MVPTNETALHIGVVAIVNIEIARPASDLGFSLLASSTPKKGPKNPVDPPTATHTTELSATNIFAAIPPVVVNIDCFRTVEKGVRQSVATNSKMAASFVVVNIVACLGSGRGSDRDGRHPMHGITSSVGPPLIPGSQLAACDGYIECCMPRIDTGAMLPGARDPVDAEIGANFHTCSGSRR
jgi:hypothetical protein